MNKLIEKEEFILWIHHISASLSVGRTAGGKGGISSIEVLANVVRGIFGCHNKCEHYRHLVENSSGPKGIFVPQMLIVSCLRNTVY